jgi:hypothetical protein
MAQTQGFQSGDQSQSAEELGKRAANPLSAGWLMQTQQNNNWVGMPLNIGDRVQSELLFQPLVNAKLTEDWTLFACPVLTLFNSTPFVNPSGRGERTTAFGDTALAFAVAPPPVLWWPFNHCCEAHVYLSHRKRPPAWTAHMATRTRSWSRMK